MIVKSLSDFFGRQIRLPAFFASELVQLTLIAREDGIFELNFRDDGEDLTPSSWSRKRWPISRKEWQKLPGIPAVLVCIWSKAMRSIFFIAAIRDSIH
jgi:hypothetical protein